MRATLSDSQTEKDRVAQARAMLGDRLQEVEDALAEVRGEKRQLEMTVGELRSDIAHSREELATAATIQSRSEEHTSELQSLMRTSYAVFCLKKKKNNDIYNQQKHKPIEFTSTIKSKTIKLI